VTGRAPSRNDSSDGGGAGRLLALIGKNYRDPSVVKTG
jgi:hypothetical protein